MSYSRLTPLGSMFLCLGLQIFLVLQPDAGLACGLTTHIEVAHRSLSLAADEDTLLMRRIAIGNQEAFHAGAAFPDIFYFPCGGPRELSEDFHWTPFMKTSVEHVRQKYGSDSSLWGNDAHELIAFLMGVVSHTVADVLWHSLGVQQGLIRTMANVNFHGQYDASHSVADNLDDSIIYFDMTMNSRQRHKPWSVPLNDILEILERYKPNSNVSGHTISQCFLVQYSLQILESVILDKMFKVNVANNLFASTKSHFLTSNFYDYHIGGMESMAINTLKQWKSLRTLLVHGWDNCKLDNNPLFVTCGEERPGNLRNNPLLHQAMKTGSEQTRRMQLRRMETLQKLAGATTMLNLARRLILSNGVLRFVPNVPESQPVQLASFGKKSKRSGAIIAKGHEEYAYFGHSMVDADLNGDSITDVVIGSPGDNQVTIHLGPVGVGNVNDQVLSGPKPFERFGASVAIADIDMDGYPDIVVGAPFSKSKGSVYVYLGSSSGYKPVHDVELFGHDVESEEWDIQDVAGLGYALDSADMNGDGYRDLVISTPFSNLPYPQCGSVFLVLGKRRAKPLGRIKITTIADWYQSGAVPYGWFGRTVRAIGAEKLSMRHGLIIVSAPYERICKTEGCKEFASEDVESVGRIYAYEVEIFGENQTVEVVPSFVLSGTVENEKLESVDVGFPLRHGLSLLAVGSDTWSKSSHYPQSGRVLLYNIEEQLLGKGETNTRDLPPVTAFLGEQASERFGTMVRFLDVDSDGVEELLVTSPFHGKGSFDGQQSGRITVYDSEHLMDLRRSAAHKPALIIEEPYSYKGRFGVNLVLFQAPTVVQGRRRPPSQLLISSPLGMETDFNQGLIYSYDLTKRQYENEDSSPVFSSIA